MRRIRLAYMTAVDQRLEAIDTLLWLIGRLRWLLRLLGLLQIGRLTMIGAAVGSVGALIVADLLGTPAVRSSWLWPMGYVVLVLVLDAVIEPLEARRERLDDCVTRMVAHAGSTFAGHLGSTQECETCRDHNPELSS